MLRMSLDFPTTSKEGGAEMGSSVPSYDTVSGHGHSASSASKATAAWRAAAKATAIPGARIGVLRPRSHFHG